MARKAYILILDLDENFDTKNFHSKLTTQPFVLNWFHYIKTSYIIIANKNYASSFHSEIQKLIPKRRFLLLEVNLKNRNGWLPTNAWNWLKNQSEQLE